MQGTVEELALKLHQLQTAEAAIKQYQEQTEVMQKQLAEHQLQLQQAQAEITQQHSTIVSQQGEIRGQKQTIQEQALQLQLYTQTSSSEKQVLCDQLLAAFKSAISEISAQYGLQAPQVQEAAVQHMTRALRSCSREMCTSSTQSTSAEAAASIPVSCC